MLLEVLDPVVVPDGAVLFQLIVGAKTVLGDDDRQAVAGIDLV